ncbi:MAG: hypothetical protein Q4D38_01405 [Planctomycetia bacterium]|nr:hypothetical protein [Planctomycetia bacterium]
MKHPILSIFTIAQNRTLFVTIFTLLALVVVPSLVPSLAFQTAFGAEAESPASSEEAVSETTESAEQDEENIFVRLRQNDTGEDVALETSILVFSSADGGLKVSLVGAIHVAEKQYYDALNEKFKTYDAVLYEVVAEKGARPEKGSQGGFLGFLQRTFGTTLGLVHQIGSIDYSGENMVHADMTPEDFKKAMEAREESFLTMYARSVGYGIARTRPNNGNSNLQFLSLLFKRNKQKELKRMFAKEMCDMDSSIEPFDSGDGSAILTDRNEHALAILKEQIDAGKTNIAIFYGAAHLPHLAEKLESDFGLTRESVEWLSAWTLE